MRLLQKTVTLFGSWKICILQGIPQDTWHSSAVDAVKGFLQIPIRDPQERQKMAFSTEKGCHQNKNAPWV
jgi:hypothetical protein